MLKSFKSKLQNRKSELEELDTMTEESTATVVLDQSSMGRLSRMDALQGAAGWRWKPSVRRKQELLLINAALRRIEKDDFGYCAVCREMKSQSAG